MIDRQQTAANVDPAVLAEVEHARWHSSSGEAIKGRWASAEALLEMALPHVETEGDDCLAHMIRQHLNDWPASEDATARLIAASTPSKEQ